MVKLRTLKKAKKELKIEIEGEGHTFCNIIQRAILRDARVDLAGYDIPHPLTSDPIFYVRTKSRTKPVTVLKAAIEAVQKDVNAFATAFQKALGKEAK